MSEFRVWVCLPCVSGEHAGCDSAACCCIVVHPGDDAVITGFKRAKQRLSPERAAWTRGGFTPPAREDAL